MRTFHFGTSGGRLLGVFHPAERQPARGTAVVICQPAGHEYIRAHRMIRTLATQLARLGTPTLRFDYYGTGDSEGEGADAGLSRWVDDTRVAIDEVERLAGVRGVALVGVRLGAAVAVRAAAGRDDVRRIVLWDPVLDGRAYLAGLEALHAAWLALGGRQDTPVPGVPLMLGFPMTSVLRGELDALNVSAALDADRRVTSLVSSDRPEDAAWRTRVTSSLGPEAFRLVSAAAGWHQPELVHTALAAPQMLQALSREIAAIP